MGMIPSCRFFDHAYAGPPPCTRHIHYPHSHSKRRHFRRDGFSEGVQVYPGDIPDGEPCNPVPPGGSF